MGQVRSLHGVPTAGTLARSAARTAPRAAIWLAAIGLLSPPALAVGPSFDCAKVQTPLAQFICASPTLSKIDLEFVQSYYALRQQAGPDGWQNLKVEAVNFENRAMQQCGISSSGSLPPDKSALQQCLIGTYNVQAAIWKSRLQQPALQEASRPIEQHISLQGRLQTLGFLPATATIDGVYGSATRDAIASWQKAANRPVTGFLDNADAEQLASSSVTTTNVAPASGANSPSEQDTHDNHGLIPMSDLAAIYARSHQ